MPPTRAQRMTAEKVVRELRRLTDDERELERLVHVIKGRLDSGDTEGLRRVASQLASAPHIRSSSEKAEVLHRVLRLLGFED
jgi:hypothetical protein